MTQKGFYQSNSGTGPPPPHTKGFYHIIVVRALHAADPGLVLCCGTRTRILRSSILTVLYIIVLLMMMSKLDGCQAFLGLHSALLLLTSTVNSKVSYR